MKNKIQVGVLGATGSVGQKFIQLLSEHPYFNLTELAASEKSAGKVYKDAVQWFLEGGIPPAVQNITVSSCSAPFQSKFLFSGLDASVAGEIEAELAARGHIIISNSKNHRWDADVPLLIPEVNPEHLVLLKEQKYNGGAIITNPNCSTIGLALALKPLHDLFGIEAVNVVTMQALSGAGYPGVASLDIIDNVIPFIGGEETKLETEPLKIFGKVNNGKIETASIKISASTNRVAVIDGHLESVQVKLNNSATEEQMKNAWVSFQSVPQKLDLPMAPKQVLHYFSEDKYPQPKLHRNIDKGMAVAIGRLRPCPIFDWKFSILSHNTVRGAAGGAILCAELLIASGAIKEL